MAVRSCVAVLLAASALTCLACTPRGMAASASVAVSASNGGAARLSQPEHAQGVAATQTLSPEVQKLARVLGGMSDRAKAAIPNGDPSELLSDLHAVLEIEQTFRADDVSLYYLIDKTHTIGADYVPKDLIAVKQNELWNVSRNDLSLRPEAYRALEELARAALRDGIQLLVSSTYRSYTYQASLFNRYVAQDGLALAERYSARPGTSQHQLGVAVDFGSITDDWGDTRMGRWVYAHAAEYGWSLSFPQGYEDVTGYMWECWHFRYIGKELCAFQKKWFGDVQQFMLEFIDAWKQTE